MIKGIRLTTAVGIERAIELSAAKRDLDALLYYQRAARLLGASALPDKGQGRELYLKAARLIGRLRAQGLANFAPVGRCMLVRGGTEPRS